MVEFVVVITAQANAYLHALACFARATMRPLSNQGKASTCVLSSVLVSCLPDVSSTGNPPPLAGNQRTPTRHTLSHPARARGETFPCTRTLHLHQQIIRLVHVWTPKQGCTTSA